MSAGSSSSSSSHRASDDDRREDSDKQSNEDVEDSTIAPYRFFPKAAYGSIEYPSTVSHPSAILRLISQRDIDECFNAPNTEGPTLEMRYGGLDGTDAPVRGTRVQSQKLLLKLTRRRRREVVGEDLLPSTKGKEKAREGTEEGVFVSEVVGPINHTVRFRSMADYHFTPNPQGRTAQLLEALRNVDYDAILGWEVQPGEEAFLREMTPGPNGHPSGRPTYHSDLDLQPLPVFSNRKVPLVYHFKNHPQGKLQDYQDPETGEWKQRYVNNRKFVTVALQRISHNHAPGDVPKGPPKNVQASIATLDQEIIARFRELLEIRPVWIRQALVAQFTKEQQRLIRNNKMYFPAVVYTFGAGPYWKTVVRYGYDPCNDPTAYRFQRIYFYMYVNRLARVAHGLELDSEDEGENNDKDRSVWQQKQAELIAEGKRPPIDDRLAASFDGKVLHGDQPDFLLCDISDPLINKIIEDPSNKIDKCDPQSGWFTSSAFELIKAITKVKYIHVWEKHTPASDDLCEAMLLEYEKGKQKEARSIAKKTKSSTRKDGAEVEQAAMEDEKDEGEDQMDEQE